VYFEPSSPRLPFAADGYLPPSPFPGAADEGLFFFFRATSPETDTPLLPFYPHPSPMGPSAIWIHFFFPFLTVSPLPIQEDLLPRQSVGLWFNGRPAKSPEPVKS